MNKNKRHQNLRYLAEQMFDSKMSLISNVFQPAMGKVSLGENRDQIKSNVTH